MNNDRDKQSFSPSFDRNSQSGEQLDRFCCRKCKNTQNLQDICICLVPPRLRNIQISQKGCPNCSCKGCSHQDLQPWNQNYQSNTRIKSYYPKSYKNSYLFQQNDDKYNGLNGQINKMTIDEKIDILYREFDIKKGCCQKCMKEYSKNGKSCLCRVSKRNRKTRLPIEGCHICSCKGCNHHDRSESSSSRRSRSRSRGRSVGSIEDKIDQKEYNMNNIDNSPIGQVIIVEYGLYPAMLGMGIPQRTPNYILGRPN